MPDNEKLNPDNKRFLDHISPNQRSTVSNIFLDVIRTGETDPVAVVRQVHDNERIHRDEPRYRNADRQAKAAILIDLLKKHYIDALALAEYYVAYNALSRSDQARLRMATTLNAVKESMAGKPTTDKQKELLCDLGFRGVVPTDRKEASEVIDRLLKTTNHDLANLSQGGAGH